MIEDKGRGFNLEKVLGPESVYQFVKRGKNVKSIDR